MHHGCVALERTSPAPFSRRKFLGAAAVGSGALIVPWLARLASADDAYPDPERGPILDYNPRVEALGALAGCAPSRVEAQQPFTARAHLPMLAADGSFPPPPPPPPPVVGPRRPEWDEATLLQVAYRHDTTEPIAALTIDDGWYARSRMLDVLKSRGAHATLFVLGVVLEQDPAFVRRALDEGHEFGNHTYDHPNVAIACANGSLPSQLQRAEAALEAIEPRARLRPYFRPPGGGYNADVVRVAADNGYRSIMWSVDPEDWRLALSPSRVVPQTQPGGIVLTHFTNSTADNLGRTIDQLQAQKGIRFTTLSELFTS